MNYKIDLIFLLEKYHLHFLTYPYIIIKIKLDANPKKKYLEIKTILSIVIKSPKCKISEYA